MLNDLFQGVFTSEASSAIPASTFLLCLAVSLGLGLILALAYMYKSRYTKSFVTTLALLPGAVCAIIMMVNGNVGTGVAVAGAFGLVRFRSVAGSAREICAIFLAMVAGLIAGTGYLGLAAVFTLVMCGMFLIYSQVDLGAKRNADAYKVLAVTIPEDLDYSGVFDDIFQEYTTFFDLTKVKSSNMGSMFKLTYHITLRDTTREKEMIDHIRCRNGNLEITVSRQEDTVTTL